MGYKDDKWDEAPGYCVECDNLRPLNKAAVCEECWNALPPSHFEPWQEDEYSSQWYYRIMHTDQLRRGVTSYIFVTPEGYTYQPNSESIEPDIENLQVLGFGEGADPQQAFERFLTQREWIRQTSFSEVLCYELAPDARTSPKSFTIA